MIAARVASDVGERLLRHPVDDQLDLRRELRQVRFDALDHLER